MFTLHLQTLWHVPEPVIKLQTGLEAAGEPNGHAVPSKRLEKHIQETEN